MGRGHGFEHQYYGYGNDGMWMESSSLGHQQQSYAVHEDHTHHRKPFPGMPMMPNMHNMHMPHHSSSSSSPSAAFRGGVISPHHHHPEQGFEFENEWQGHGYPAGGPRKLGFGPTNNFSEEATEYDRSYSEERYGGGGAMIEHGDEMRFHRHNYGGGNYGGGFGFNPYDNNFASKPQYGYQHPVDWRARGV